MAKNKPVYRPMSLIPAILVRLRYATAGQAGIQVF
jgi:hypothetical protein